MDTCPLAAARESGVLLITSIMVGIRRMPGSEESTSNGTIATTSGVVGRAGGVNSSIYLSCRSSHFVKSAVAFHAHREQTAIKHHRGGTYINTLRDLSE